MIKKGKKEIVRDYGSIWNALFTTPFCWVNLYDFRMGDPIGACFGVAMIAMSFTIASSTFSSSLPSTVFVSLSTFASFMCWQYIHLQFEMVNNISSSAHVARSLTRKWWRPERWARRPIWRRPPAWSWWWPRTWHCTSARKAGALAPRTSRITS